MVQGLFQWSNLSHRQWRVRTIKQEIDPVDQKCRCATGKNDPGHARL
jgi:hypothetical protein